MTYDEISKLIEEAKTLTRLAQDQCWSFPPDVITRGHYIGLTDINRKLLTQVTLLTDALTTILAARERLGRFDLLCRKCHGKATIEQKIEYDMDRDQVVSATGLYCPQCQQLEVLFNALCNASTVCARKPNA